MSPDADQSSTADGTYWIRRIPQPILMVRDGGDTIIQSFEPYMLLSAATAPGSLQRIATHLKFSRDRASHSGPFSP